MRAIAQRAPRIVRCVPVLRHAPAAPLALALFAAFPAAACADVVISEIAWMGSAASANDEWIELHNDGAEPVGLEGWQITAEDGSPTIELEGGIGAGAYFLLERTDDETVPAIAADQLYTGSLSNDGEVLRLHDADGSIRNRVNGADGWSLGGDNESKHTLQRAGSEWITAPATPGRENAARSERAATTAAPEDEADDTSRSETRTGGASGARIIDPESDDDEPIQLVSPKQELHLTIGEDRRGVVGQEFRLEARAFAPDGDRLPADITWNLGDGTLAEGRRISHAFAHEGTYVVSARAELTRFREELAAHARITIDVASAHVAGALTENGGLSLTNEEPYELDLSGWQIVYGDAAVTLPRDTYVLPERTITLPQRVTGFSAEGTERLALYYPDGTPVAGANRLAERGDNAGATGRDAAPQQQNDRDAIAALARVLQDTPPRAPSPAPASHNAAADAAAVETALGATAAGEDPSNAAGGAPEAETAAASPAAPPAVASLAAAAGALEQRRGDASPGADATWYLALVGVVGVAIAGVWLLRTEAPTEPAHRARLSQNSDGASRADGAPRDADPLSAEAREYHIVEDDPPRRA